MTMRSSTGRSNCASEYLVAWSHKTAWDDYPANTPCNRQWMEAEES